MRTGRIQLLFGLVSLSAVFAIAAPADEKVEIRGTVKDCWLGKVIPTRGIMVYAYDIETNKPIFEVLEKIRHLLPFDDSPEGLQRYAEKFNPLYDELLKLVEARHQQTRHTKTNKVGQFAFSGLPPGRAYLVLAIALR